jgi:hypothetical protein
MTFNTGGFTTLGKKDDLLEPGRWNLKVPREKEKVVPFFGIILKDCMFYFMCTVSISITIKTINYNWRTRSSRKARTVLGSIPASSRTVESEARQIKQFPYYIKNLKNKKSLFF